MIGLVIFVATKDTFQSMKCGTTTPFSLTLVAKVCMKQFQRNLPTIPRKAQIGCGALGWTLYASFVLAASLTMDAAHWFSTGIFRWTSTCLKRLHVNSFESTTGTALLQ